MKIVGVMLDDAGTGVRFERAFPEEYTVSLKPLEKLLEDGPFYGGMTIIVEEEDDGSNQRTTERS